MTFELDTSAAHDQYGSLLPYTGAPIDLRTVAAIGVLALAGGLMLRGRWGFASRRSIVIMFACLLFTGGFIAGQAHAATWRSHTVTTRFDGQIDASPCPEPSCLRGIVGVYVDGSNVHDNVVRCGWPRHRRIVAFDHGRHHHRYGWYVKVRTCGRFYWWRFR